MGSGISVGTRKAAAVSVGPATAWRVSGSSGSGSRASGSVVSGSVGSSGGRGSGSMGSAIKW